MDPVDMITALRFGHTVEHLQHLAKLGFDTPVSGDLLAVRRSL